jgi:hypothetical protein
MQYNKQDLPSSLVATVGELSAALNFRQVPEFAADALQGPGVFETLRALGMSVLRRLGAGETGAATTEGATHASVDTTSPPTRPTGRPRALAGTSA